jgi:hypothetical protein
MIKLIFILLRNFMKHFLWDSLHRGRGLTWSRLYSGPGSSTEDILSESHDWYHVINAATRGVSD